MVKEGGVSFGLPNPITGEWPEEGHAMLEYTIDVLDGPAPEVKQTLDELAREGARRMLSIFARKCTTYVHPNCTTHVRP